MVGLDLKGSDRLSGATERGVGADAVQAIKAVGDRTRLQILRVLLQGEQCVTDIAQMLGLAQPRISHHLTILRNSGLVLDRRKGKQIIYSVNPLFRTTHNGGSPAVQVDCLRVEFAEN
ncbi:MAG: ArsR/SmtB family transcription factor [Acidobacteriota bacterium]